MKKLLNVMTVVFMTFILIGCSDGDGESPTKENLGTGTVKGVVMQANDSRLSGVSVTINKETVTTDVNGAFTLNNISKSESLVINFVKEGFVSTAEVETIDEKETRYLEIYMKEKGQTQIFTAITGGTIKVDNGSVVIGKDSIIDSDGNIYNGTVHTALTYFDPTTDDGLDAFPGEFVGIETNGSSIPIISYGYMDITLLDSEGEKLQLAAGKIAELTISVPTSLQADAPNSMPRWHFNQDDGQWHEEGVGVLNATRTAYVGNVSHFSIWNNDVGTISSYVSGKVVACSSQEPIKGARVTNKGISPRKCWTSGETSTPSDGSFTNIPVDSKSIFKTHATKYFDGFLRTSTIKEYTAESSGKNVELGNICIQMCSNGKFYNNGTCVTDTSSGLNSDGTIQTIAGIKFLVEEPSGYFNYAEASSWCTAKGYRLPSTTELIAVWDENGGSLSPDGFEKDTFYWANNKNTLGQTQGCAMDYNCSEAEVWGAETGNGHPKCVIDGTTNPISTSTVTHNGISYGTVISPYTGRTWLDRNLGATQVCTAINDTQCYGDYYQWGRNTDGHEKSNSAISSTQATNYYAYTGSEFIASNDNDWTLDDLDGASRNISWGNFHHNTICPTGYTVPTSSELQAETIDQNFINETSMFTSFLKVPSAGWRASFSGDMFDEGDFGYLWSSTNSNINAGLPSSEALSFGHGQIGITHLNRNGGHSVRCIGE